LIKLVAAGFGLAAIGLLSRFGALARQGRPLLRLASFRGLSRVLGLLPRPLLALDRFAPVRRLAPLTLLAVLGLRLAGFLLRLARIVVALVLVGAARGFARGGGSCQPGREQHRERGRDHGAGYRNLHDLSPA